MAKSTIPQELSDQVRDYAKLGIGVQDAITRFTAANALTVKQVRDIYRWCVARGYADEVQLTGRCRITEQDVASAWNAMEIEGELKPATEFGFTLQQAIRIREGDPKLIKLFF